MAKKTITGGTPVSSDTIEVTLTLTTTVPLRAFQDAAVDVLEMTKQPANAEGALEVFQECAEVDGMSCSSLTWEWDFWDGNESWKLSFEDVKNG